MNHLFRTLLAAGLAAITVGAASPPPIAPATTLLPNEVAAVQRTVFVRMFTESIREAEKASTVLFLRLGCGDGQAPVKATDPTAPFLSELREAGWNVRPASAALHPHDKQPYKDRETNRDGLLFCVGTIETVGPSDLRVFGESYRDGKSAEGTIYGVARVGNSWQVVSRRSRWKA